MGQYGRYYPALFMPDLASVTSSSSSSSGTRLLRGAFGGLAVSMLSNVFLFIGQIIIPRVLSRPDYAAFTVSVSFVALIALIADFGMTSMFTREFAEAAEDRAFGLPDRRGELLGTALILRLLLSVLVAGIVLLVAPTLYAPAMVSNMSILLLTMLISSRMLIVRGVIEAFLRSGGKYYLAAAFGLLDSLTFASLFLLSSSTLTVNEVVWRYVLCNVPGFILIVIWLIRWTHKEGIHMRVSFRQLAVFVRIALPLSLTTAFVTLNNEADKLLIDRLSTPMEVSGYAAMIRLSTAVLPLSAGLAYVVGPELTRLLRRGEEAKSVAITEVALKLLLIVACGIALLLLSTSHLVVGTMLGPKYVGAFGLLQAVGWMLVPLMVSTFLLELAIAAGRFWVTAIYTGCLMISIVSGDLILIPEFGAWGALTSKLVSVTMGTVGLILFSKDRYINRRHFVASLIRVGVSAILGLAVVFTQGILGLGSIPCAAISLAVYFFALHFTHAFRLQEFLIILRRTTGQGNR